MEHGDEPPVDDPGAPLASEGDEKEHHEAEEDSAIIISSDEEQPAAKRISKPKKAQRVREQEEYDRIACEKKKQREKDEEARSVEEIESNKRRKLDKQSLYYHCKFNGVNNTCYWAPLAEGVLTYGELVASSTSK
jgi:hypothetical protein